MGFPVNADFVRMFWSFMGQVPFTLCVMAASTAEQIHNLAYMGFILTAYILLSIKQISGKNLSGNPLCQYKCVYSLSYARDVIPSLTKPAALKTGDVGIKRRGDKKKN